MCRFLNFDLISCLFNSIASTNCRRDEDQKDNGKVDTTKLTSYTEPFYGYGASKSRITSLYGDDFEKVPADFGQGYTMAYESEVNGVQFNGFWFDGGGELDTSLVMFYPGKENVDFLKSFLDDRYTLKLEENDQGITGLVYEGPNVHVTLIYEDGTYDNIGIFYGPLTEIPAIGKESVPIDERYVEWPIQD